MRLGVDFILCTREFYENVKTKWPKLAKEENGKCYLWKYRCEFVEEITASEGKISLSSSYGMTKRIGHVNKPSRQEFMDAKYKRKNFAKDYLMKGKRW